MQVNRSLAQRLALQLPANSRKTGKSAETSSLRTASRTIYLWGPLPETQNPLEAGLHGPVSGGFFAGKLGHYAW